jgi:hypothetical protein
MAMKILDEDPKKKKKNVVTKVPPTKLVKKTLVPIKRTLIKQTALIPKVPTKTPIKKTAPVKKTGPITKAPPINTAAPKTPIKKTIRARENYSNGKLISKEYQDSTGKWIKQL